MAFSTPWKRGSPISCPQKYLLWKCQCRDEKIKNNCHSSNMFLMTFFILHLKIVLWWWRDPHNSCLKSWFVCVFSPSLLLDELYQLFQFVPLIPSKRFVGFFPFSFTPSLAPPCPASTQLFFPRLIALFFSLWIAVLNSTQIISSELRVFPSHDMIFYFFLS